MDPIAAARRSGGDAANAPALEQSAADAARTGDEPTAAVLELVDHAIGRSRGGLPTKIRALADGSGRPLMMMLTGGNVHDTTMFGPLLAH